MLTQDGECIVTLFRQMQPRRFEGFSESFYMVAGDFKIKANRDVREQLEINDPPTAQSYRSPDAFDYLVSFRSRDCINLQKLWDHALFIPASALDHHSEILQPTYLADSVPTPIRPANSAGVIASA